MSTRETAIQPTGPRRRAGLTLLELLIILAVVAVIIFIALPTLKPTEVEATSDFAKQQLLYLYGREQAYYNLRGTYAPFSVIAADPDLGPTFDPRFSTNEVLVNGVVFTGPSTEAATYEIVATLPDQSKYKIDNRGQITPMLSAANI
ncbi:prepilin-type N-terminal cleavage/methylation domain-containing protein [bacterium]|nr:prepilin-type N-terminal cleavage/methylation domain-containing protein [bacterium]